MKKKYYILMLFTIIVSTLSFTACTNDDDNDNINENNYADLIIGKWELVDLPGVDLEGQAIYLKFVKNGLGCSYAYDESYYVENKFSWIINGNMLYLKFEDDYYDYSFTLRILQLNHRKLLLKEKVDYGGGELIWTLHKVN